ncbi:hypothetical protein L8R80_14160 [Vibrio splendidus]|uniref:hypothetical protein n=1 Tax=Vibrio splendidus TaxID=29497 RepID=UPI0024688E4A|nr:hypothetical protein [Vibrio splendidus]MDH5911404.1 hypothetical protein [Vibrio splendidus]MDH5942811.1 hypothetical protein [Vibrio splendidus]MDH5985642.1 hypothetical protein [Vibrio splendidus]MDH5994388.1 hypothetical protein [Vibrio splendidus]MDH6005069.1 hypothetical protein [Vibrio splendidus]
MLNTSLLFLPTQNRQQKQSLWALFLTGLVIVTCLASTLSANKVTSSASLIGQSILVGAETSHPQAIVASFDKMSELYASVFGSEASKMLTSPNSSSCSLSSKMLTFAAPKTGWLLPFVLMIAVAFNLSPHISRLSGENHRSSRPTKHRLHLKHCIFKE